MVVFPSWWDESTVMKAFIGTILETSKFFAKNNAYAKPIELKSFKSNFYFRAQKKVFIYLINYRRMSGKNFFLFREREVIHTNSQLNLN